MKNAKMGSKVFVWVSLLREEFSSFVECSEREVERNAGERQVRSAVGVDGSFWKRLPNRTVLAAVLRR